jgi:hypothetical protein
MKFKFFAISIFVLAVTSSCSRSNKSNEQFSDTSAVYNQSTNDSLARGFKSDSAAGSDSIGDAGIDNNNQAPRVHVGKDTVGKSENKNP